MEMIWVTGHVILLLGLLMFLFVGLLLVADICRS
jgi:hypothetical protein